MVSMHWWAAVPFRQQNLVEILIAFTSLDFSSNQFERPIPEELMKLKAPHALNLSQNAFSGSIPSALGNLKHLESLDLSFNYLSGEIPTELASLSFLAVMNLSYNHLVGRIPTGTQIHSFTRSFLGLTNDCWVYSCCAVTSVTQPNGLQEFGTGVRLVEDKKARGEYLASNFECKNFGHRNCVFTSMLIDLGIRLVLLHCHKHSFSEMNINETDSDGKASNQGVKDLFASPRHGRTLMNVETTVVKGFEFISTVCLMNKQEFVLLIGLLWRGSKLELQQWVTSDHLAEDKFSLSQDQSALFLVANLYVSFINATIDKEGGVKFEDSCKAWNITAMPCQNILFDGCTIFVHGSLISFEYFVKQIGPELAACICWPHDEILHWSSLESKPYDNWYHFICHSTMLVRIRAESDGNVITRTNLLVRQISKERLINLLHFLRTTISKGFAYYTEAWKLLLNWEMLIVSHSLFIWEMLVSRRALTCGIRLVFTALEANYVMSPKLVISQMFQVLQILEDGFLSLITFECQNYHVVAVFHRKMVDRGRIRVPPRLLKWKILPPKHGTWKYSSLRTRMLEREGYCNRVNVGTYYLLFA